jgi:hypothetical protein
MAFKHIINYCKASLVRGLGKREELTHLSASALEEEQVDLSVFPLPSKRGYRSAAISERFSNLYPLPGKDP